MTLFNSGDQPTPRLPGDAPNISPRAARTSFALALIALAVGLACIMGEHWRPGLILMFAAVAGTMTSLPSMLTARQTRKRTSQQSTDDDHTA